MVTKRKNIDWEGVEGDYRAGQLAIRAIAEKYGTKEGTIRSRAKKQEWERDLSDQVQQATKNKLSRTVSRTSRTSEEMRETDDEIIEQASNETVALVLKHRKGIARYWQIADEFSGQLKDLEVTKDNYHTYSRSLNSGVDALGKAIKLERQAFNLDDQQEKQQTSDLAELMDSMEYPNIAVT